MKAKLTVNSVETEIDFEELESVCADLGEYDRHSNIFKELSKSEFEDIRVTVASRKTISDETVKLLTKDASIEVLRAIINNRYALRYLDKAGLEHMLDTEDSEICLKIADNLEEFSNLMDLDALCESLIGKGPAVRLRLAENNITPAFILMELSHDREFMVAEKAKETFDEVWQIIKKEDEEEEEDDDEDDDEESDDKTGQLKCSFCDKSQDEVKKLFAGPRTYICSECVEICYEIIQEDKSNEKEGDES